MPNLVEDAVDDFTKLTEHLPASVTATRTSEADVKTRQLIVWIDGRQVGDLLWGDSIRCDLEPGPHVLRVSNTLVWKTAKFTLRPGEQAYFEAVNRMGPGSVMMTMLFGAGPLYVTLKRMC
jgi:hypothetical protein